MTRRDAFHEFVAVGPSGERMVANIAGPVCESGDTFALGARITSPRLAVRVIVLRLSIGRARGAVPRSLPPSSVQPRKRR